MRKYKKILVFIICLLPSLIFAEDILEGPSVDLTTYNKSSVGPSPILSNGTYLVVLNATEPAPTDKYGVWEYATDGSSNGSSDQPISNRNDTAEGHCRQLSVFLCLEQNCRWIQGKCDERTGAGSYNLSQNGTFPTTLPVTVDGMIYLLELMYNNPPQDPNTSPTVWLVFFAVSLTLVATIVIVGTLGSIYYCLRRCYIRWTERKLIRKQGEAKDMLAPGSHRRKMVIVLPSGNRVTVDSYIVDHTGGERKLIIFPSSYNASFLEDAFLNFLDKNPEQLKNNAGHPFNLDVDDEEDDAEEPKPGSSGNCRIKRVSFNNTPQLCVSDDDDDDENESAEDPATEIRTEADGGKTDETKTGMENDNEASAVGEEQGAVAGPSTLTKTLPADADDDEEPTVHSTTDEIICMEELGERNEIAVELAPEAESEM